MSPEEAVAQAIRKTLGLTHTVTSDTGTLTADDARKAVDWVIARAAIEAYEKALWQPIETAPKSTSRATPHGKHVKGVYLLGYCADAEVTDKKGRIFVVWWEPNINGGAWWGEGDFPLNPIHWMHLPEPPK